MKFRPIFSKARRGNVCILGERCVFGSVLLFFYWSKEKSKKVFFWFFCLEQQKRYLGTVRKYTSLCKKNVLLCAALYYKHSMLVCVGISDLAEMVSVRI